MAEWKDFDARYGQYLDGSAFTEAAGYYGPGMGVPVTHFYLPCHENWPMGLEEYYLDRAKLTNRLEYAEWAKKSRSLDKAFDPAYPAGYRRVVSDMFAHFQEKGWTKTAFQFYFNNKYYRKCKFFGDSTHGCSYWVLDEPTDYDDYDANRYFLSLCRSGVRASDAKDVRVHYRTDVSQADKARGLWDGVCNLWNSSRLRAVFPTALVRQKWLPHETWWSYGGGIGITNPSIRQIDGYLRRYTWGAAGELSYYTNFGGRSCWKKASNWSIYYTGNRYAGTTKVFDGPIAGLRMKVMRRGQQDIEYLNLLASREGWDRDQVVKGLAEWSDDPASEVGHRFKKLTVEKLSALREAIASTIERAGGD